MCIHFTQNLCSTLYESCIGLFKILPIYILENYSMYLGEIRSYNIFTEFQLFCKFLICQKDVVLSYIVLYTLGLLIVLHLFFALFFGVTTSQTEVVLIIHFVYCCFVNYYLLLFCSVSAIHFCFTPIYFVILYFC